MIFQSARPFRGGTGGPGRHPGHQRISIRPSLAGRDVIRTIKGRYLHTFQSSRPLRGGTRNLCHTPAFGEISIHPPLAGRDCATRRRRSRPDYFNPPAPCGAGLRVSTSPRLAAVFQSTRPLRGGTVRHGAGQLSAVISIHPPLAGRDRWEGDIHKRSRISIHPHLAGRDLVKGGLVHCLHAISIHPPLAGRDCISTKRAGRRPRRPADTGPAGYRQKAKCWRPERGR